MRMPKRVKVGPFTYQIKTVPGLLDERHIYGECDSRKHEISISDEMTGPLTAETLIHELMHAAWETGSIGIEGLTEEKVIRILATQFAAIIRDNPSLVAWIQESLEGESHEKSRGRRIANSRKGDDRVGKARS
jgi:hypothetical protein